MGPKVYLSQCPQADDRRIKAHHDAFRPGVRRGLRLNEALIDLQDASQSLKNALSAPMAPATKADLFQQQSPVPQSIDRRRKAVGRMLFSYMVRESANGRSTQSETERAPGLGGGDEDIDVAYWVVPPILNRSAGYRPQSDAPRCLSQWQSHSGPPGLDLDREVTTIMFACGLACQPQDRLGRPFSRDVV